MHFRKGYGGGGIGGRAGTTAVTSKKKFRTARNREDLQVQEPGRSTAQSGHSVSQSGVTAGVTGLSAPAAAGWPRRPAQSESGLETVTHRPGAAHLFNLN